MATANAATNMSLRQVRGLAQKLWGQCRESTSLYRTLAPDVKRMRNLLEDLEDQYTDDDDIPLRVVERLHKCQSSLHRLELTLKAYHTSTHKWQDVRPTAVEELKKGIERTTEELRVAFEGNAIGGDDEATKTTEPTTKKTLEPPSDNDQTRAISEAPRKSPPTIPRRPVRSQQPPSLVPPTEPATTVQSSDSTPSSVPSSALTAHDSVTGFSCSPSAPKTSRTDSEEKQVLAGPSVLEEESVPDWRRLYVDPLSVDIEEASKWITGSWRGEAETEMLVEEPKSRKEVNAGVAKVRTLPVAGMQEPEAALDGRRGSTSLTDGLEGQGQGLGIVEIEEGKPFQPGMNGEGKTVPEPTIRTVRKDGLTETEEHTDFVKPMSSEEPASAQPKVLPEQDESRVDSSATAAQHSHESEQAPTTPEIAPLYPETRSTNVSPHNASLSNTQELTPQELEQSQLLATFTAELEKRFEGQTNDKDAGMQGEATVANEIEQATIKSEFGGAGAEEANEQWHDARSSRASPAQVFPEGVTAEKGRKSQSDGLDIGKASSARATSTEAWQHTQPNGAQPTVNGKSSTTQDSVPEAIPEAKHGSPIEATDSPASPPPPSRAPPPPPPPRSRIAQKTAVPKRRPPPPPPSLNSSPQKSRYRVVNISPEPVRQSETSAEDDLYSTSRPTSPKQPADSQIISIPEVKVTECETKEDRPRSIVMLTSSLKPSTHPSTRRRASTQGISHVAFCMAPEVDHGQRLRGRKSVDETFNVDSLEPIRDLAPAVQRSRSVSAPERPRSLSIPQPPAREPSPSPKVSAEEPRPAKVLEYYGNPNEPVEVTQAQYSIDAERIERICQCWNSQLWDSADAYLMGHLESLIETNQLDAARRVRHLLGVCASFRGQWERALTLFISVLRTPIKAIDELDAGDCAAAYWLGDTYAMMNRRTEALLAYCIAEQHQSSQDAAAVSLQKCLTSDQHAVQLGLSKADFKVRWAQEALNGHGIVHDTILHPSIVTQEAAKACLNSQQGRKGKLAPEYDVDGSRASLLFSLDRSSMEFKHYQRMNLTRQSFLVPYQWPMPYDPLFAMENVSRGRLLAYECDLLDVFRTNPEAKVPRNGPLGLGRMDCFTCNDLEWLIVNLRDCLHTLEMDWSEVANVEGVWFLARYHTMRDKIATTDYFSIALFQQSLRSGYGVEVCPDGISSARLIKCTYEYKKGVEWKAEKRTRDYIKRYLEKAYRQKTTRRESIKSKPLLAGASPLLARAHTSSVPVATTSAVPPPIPPRPASTMPAEVPVAADPREVP